MGVHSQPGTRTPMLWGSTVPGPTWEAGGTRTATRPTSMVFMASTVIIRYNSPLYLNTDNFICYDTTHRSNISVSALTQGIVWIDWKGKDASIPFTEMKFRPSRFSPATHG